MKKTITVLLLLLLLITVTACNQAQEATEEEPAPVEEPAEVEEVGASEDVIDSEPIRATLVHGTPSGSWYLLSNGIAETLDRTYPGSLLDLMPGGSGPNVFRLNAHETDFALVHTSMCYEALNGIGAYEEKQEHLRAVAAFYPSRAQFFLKADIGIMTFDEFIEQKPALKLSIGSLNGSGHVSFIRMLEAYDLTLEDLEDWGCTLYTKNLTDTKTMFSDGALDGFYSLVSAPHPAFVEACLNRDVVFVDLGEYVIQYICDNYGYSPAAVEAGTYSFMDKDYDSYCSYSFLGVHEDVAEDVVYKMTKSIAENLDYLGNTHANLKGLTPGFLADTHGVPLHPGAERYYKEAGILN